MESSHTSAHTKEDDNMLTLCTCVYVCVYDVCVCVHVCVCNVCVCMYMCVFAAFLTKKNIYFTMQASLAHHCVVIH